MLNAEPLDSKARGQITLYYAPGSCAFAALVALEVAGAEYEPIRLDLAAGDQRTPQYRALNPLGRVPTLVVDGKPVTELIAVLTYISSLFPAAELMPVNNPFLLAKSYEMLSWFSTTLHVYVAQILRGERFSDDENVRAALKEFGRRQLAEQLIRLDQLSAGASGGLIGNRMTVVDAFSLVIWRWAERLGIDTSGLTHWAATVERMLALPAVRRAKEIEASEVAV